MAGIKSREITGTRRRVLCGGQDTLIQRTSSSKKGIVGSLKNKDTMDRKNAIDERQYKATTKDEWVD